MEQARSGQPMTPSSLRELAEKAMPGPWFLREGDALTIWSNTEGVAKAFWADDAPFLAAANPLAILGLLDRIQALEGALVPFAEQADAYEPDDPDHLRDWPGFTIADFRRARALLSPPGLGNEDDVVSRDHDHSTCTALEK